MDYDKIKFVLNTSPSFKLLTSPHAAFILSFLYIRFKKAEKISIPNAELVEVLSDYLEDLRKNNLETYPKTAQCYIDDWCDDDHGFLRRYHDTNSDDPVLELTPETEKVFQWLEDIDKKEFVGTESRFLRIFQELQDIINKSTEDPKERLNQLQKQKENIEAEIEKIRSTGQVDLLNSTQIKEKFFWINNEARKLLSDFRQVEQNFKDITHSIKEKQLKEALIKGMIVGFVLDADDSLKDSDQGKSFYAFWRFLMSPSKQEELKYLVERVYNLPDIRALETDDKFLKKIKKNLLDSGEKVIKSNHRLSEQLRKILDEKNFLENQRVIELIREIEQIALGIIERNPIEKDFIFLESNPDIELVMDRPLWMPVQKPSFRDILIEVGQDELKMDDLFNQFFIDETELRQRIHSFILYRPQITLEEVIEKFPIERGISELIAYFKIASEDSKHIIDDENQVHIIIKNEFDSNKLCRRIKTPQIIFTR